VRSLRKRQLISSFDTLRSGAYWGIRSDIRNYGLPESLSCPFDKTTVLANTKTRLKKLDGVTQERLINWGYAICDVAMRKWVDPTLPAAATFPYQGSGIG
jgi:NTE family protein